MGSGKVPREKNYRERKDEEEKKERLNRRNKDPNRVVSQASEVYVI